jgi:catechol 2,3-dioxygenase-like lactoylglutathione lyase family enzyme
MSVTGRVLGTLPASDLARAKEFYALNLGLKPVREDEAGVVYECAQDTRILLFPSMGKPSGTHTQAMFEVDNLDGEMKRMRANGVVFEEYDHAEFKSENGVVTDKDGHRAAWFHDSEGNLLCIGDPMPV